MSHISKKELEKQVFLAARDQGINNVLFRNALGRAMGLNVTDSECLSFLTIKGTSTPTELARYTGLTSGSTTAMLDRLVKGGFIRRRPNPDDRRGILIEIDPRSAEKSRSLVAGIQQAHRELIAGYSVKELEAIADFLTRFARNVADHTQALYLKH